jgi:hypothetical protein
LTWDDTEAGHQWRLHQARIFIGKVKIKATAPGNQEVTVLVPKYANLSVQSSHGGQRRGYLQVEQAMKEEDLYLQALGDVIKYLNGFKRRISAYEAARAIAPHLDAAIEAAEEQIQLTKEQNGNTSTG